MSTRLTHNLPAAVLYYLGLVLMVPALYVLAFIQGNLAVWTGVTLLTLSAACFAAAAVLGRFRSPSREKKSASSSGAGQFTNG